MSCFSGSQMTKQGMSLQSEGLFNVKDNVNGLEQKRKSLSSSWKNVKFCELIQCSWRAGLSGCVKTAVVSCSATCGEVLVLCMNFIFVHFNYIEVKLLPVLLIWTSKKTGQSVSYVVFLEHKNK